MTFIEKSKHLLKNDWIISLGILLVFLATNGYTYAWDDQHLEIPLLKSLIDPGLFVGDYYVEALKANFTTFLFPILAKFITTAQVPTAYFILYLISRFFLFFYAYKLWKLISGSRFTAAFCVLSFFLIFRVEEFLYRTFSHQEFAIAIVMAAIYYFYKERYLRAAIIFGIAANFHALYSLFPFCYMGLFLLWKTREDKCKTLFKSIGLFVLFSLPFFIWTFQRFFMRGPQDPSLYKNWPDLYMLACQATFLFDTIPLKEMAHHLSAFLKGTQQFWPVAGLYILNYFHNPSFKKDAKAQCFMIAGCLFLVMAFIFSYVFPSRFFLDLNLARNLQFMQFILIGYTTILIIDKIKNGSWALAACAVLLFSLLRFNGEIAALAALATTFLLWDGKKNLKIIAWGLLTLITAGIVFEFHDHHFSKAAMLTVYLIGGIIIFLYLAFILFKDDKIKIAVLIVPFAALTVNNIYYHKLHLNIEQRGGGFWQLQRNWIDMQNFVRTHTPKNALILTPNDMEMGGFRIFSERKVLVCYRDCGVIGFDYKAAVEWQKRLKDVEHFKVIVDGDITPALINAITKYKVNYIVFMRYLKATKNSLLEPVYENETFTLFRVTANPI